MDRPERSGGLVDSVLAHYGVKGMKWGVRRANPSGPQEVKVKSYAGNRIVRTTGGKGHALSEDATRAAVARRKAKKSNVRSLSNKELQDLVNRMNLEQQYAQLEKKRVDRGKQTAQNLFDAGKAAVEVYQQLKK